MSKTPRRNINFRQTAREFRAMASAKVGGHIQRLFPYTKYQAQKVWTLVTKPVKIASDIKLKIQNAKFKSR